MVKVDHSGRPNLPYTFCGRNPTDHELRYGSDGKYGRDNDWIGIGGYKDKNRPSIGKMREIEFFVAKGDYCGLFEYNYTLMCPECAQEQGLLW